MFEPLRESEALEALMCHASPKTVCNDNPHPKEFPVGESVPAV